MRIVVCDDHPIIVLGVKSLLAAQEDGFRVIGEAFGGEQLLKLLGTTPCDLLITDFAMPGAAHGCEGLPLLRRVHQAHPSLPVIVLTMIRSPALTKAMLAMGVCGIVDKTRMMAELVRAVRTVSNGYGYLDGQTGAEAADVITNDELPNRLSVREAEVVRLYAQGFSVTDIARLVQRSVKTVSKQKNDAMHKLGLHGNGELCEFARLHGLVS